MGRPATMGRSILFRGGLPYGINMGIGGYEEHNFPTLEHGVKLVEQINSVPRDSFLCSMMLNGHAGDVKSIIKNYKRDKNFQKRLIKTEIRKCPDNSTLVEFQKLSNFLLRPNVYCYTRKIEIDNSKYKYFGNKVALVDGRYGIINICGLPYVDKVRDKLLNRKKISENELFFSRDYANSMFVTQEKFMGSYTYANPTVTLAINIDNIDMVILYENLLKCLKRGYLALVPNPFGKTGLAFIMVDILLFREERNLL